jgi:hypothetical protein
MADFFTSHDALMPPLPVPHQPRLHRDDWLRDDSPARSIATTDGDACGASALQPAPEGPDTTDTGSACAPPPPWMCRVAGPPPPPPTGSAVGRTLPPGHVMVLPWALPAAVLLPADASHATPAAALVLHAWHPEYMCPGDSDSCDPDDSPRSSASAGFADQSVRRWPPFDA